MSAYVRHSRGRPSVTGVARLLVTTAFIVPSAALAQVQTGSCFAQPGPSGGFTFAGSCQASSSSLIGLTGTGATGPGGSGADLFNSATDGGPGAIGPALTFRLLSGAQLLQQASGGNALSFSSTGGIGGTGGHDAVVRHAGDGGSGGDGGVITVVIAATSAVNATGDNADAVYAISSGGTGGQGGADVDGGLGDGNGGPGGNGGDISVVNNGALLTAGTYSSAIFAHSDGGTGGDGSPAQSFFGNGGSGGVGGNSGADITASNTGTATTSGANATAIVLQSVGGNGGDGGGGQGAFYSKGGSGGIGGNGEDIQFANSGTIQTQGDHADAVNAYSIGGGGGHGGSAVTAGAYIGVAIGGSGGGGGDSGSVTLTNAGSIVTAGINAKGMVGSSIGGGGGDANAVTDVTYGLGRAWNFSFGGSGGMGGTAGAVVVKNQAGGSIVTGAPADDTPQDAGNAPIPGDHASGILAQSLGGGGGHGAQTVSVAASAGYASLSLGLVLGGSGGAGGSGGTVSVISDGAITTHARLADGILAQSVGGGGGKGGTSINVDASVGEYTGNLSVVLGGGGGSGGSGAAVSAELGGSISTYSSQSRGIFAQSVGGGGGSAGNILNVDAAVGSNAVGLGVSLGGTGGGGGSGSTVVVTTDTGSAISTLGHYSDGILAQSIGGGGGGGGSVNSYAISAINGSGLAASANVGVGGTGGSGGMGAAVTVAHGGAITTAGDYATGLFAQSVGGGGGVGGSVFELSVAASLDAKDAKGNALGGRDISASVSVGGTGGAGNVGGDVVVSLQPGASIVTTGESASGLVAQSVGGGGGAGGIAHSFAVSTPVPTSPQRVIDQIVQWMVMAQKIFDKTSDSGEPDGQYKNGLEASVSVGGNGGIAGVGGDVTVNLASDISIQTSGGLSHGVHAQSVGGGGGIGGMANSNGFAGFGEFGLTFSMGGAGGNGNDGGHVSVVGSGPDGTTAGIATSGMQSAGLFAQSIGGGGGAGGSADSTNYSVPGLSKKSIQIALGGSAGAQGNGGDIDVKAAPNIMTSGGGSAAIFAQSVGGGGGSGGASNSTGLISFSMGGSGGGGGDGGEIRIKGDALLATTGATSAGIVAQSVGGGGGAGGISSATLLGQNAGLHLSLGGDGGAAGQGGAVLIDWTGGIHTSGAVSMGVFAQSVGGSGGLVQGDNATVIGGSIPIPITHAGGSGDGGQVFVSDVPADLLTVTTSGAGAHGIVAQSIGGSGSAVILDEALAKFDVNESFGGTSSGAGGDVAVTLNGSVVTSGANAYGIVAQSLTNATVLFGTDGIQIGQEPVGSYGGSVQVLLQGTVTTTGSGAHGIATYMNTEGGGSGGNVQVGGTVNVSGAGAWGVYTSNGLALTSGTLVNRATTQVSVVSGGTVNATGSAAGAINMADWNGEAFADVSGTLNAPDAIALQSNTSGELIVNLGGVVIGDIVSTGADFAIDNEGSITGSVSGVSTYSIGNGAHFLRFDPTATLGSDSIAVQQLQVPGNSINPVLIALPNGSVTTTRIIAIDGATDTTPVPPDKVGSYGLSSGTVAAQYSYAFTMSTASITDVSIDFTRGGFSGNTQQLASLANSHLLGWPADAPTSPSALYTLLVHASNATTSAQLSQYLQNLDATASYDSVQQSATAAGAAHAGMQSCGNPVGLYSLIDQSSCNWAKTIYAVTTLRDGDQRDTSAGISIGRQGEASDNVYVGASFAYESTSFDGVGSTSDGDRISLGAIAKYVDGPLYASASVVGSYGWADGSRSSSLPWVSGLASSDQETWALTGRLRAGYVFKLGQLELMPLVDFDMLGIFDQGYTEQGLDDLAFHVAPSNNVLFDLRPALRIGGTTKMNDAFITSYIELGALFALNEGLVDVSLANGPNPAASVSLALERDEVMATFAVGSAIDWGAYELRLLYEGAWGDTTISQTGSVKFAIKF